MRCPKCRTTTEVVKMQYFELAGDNSLSAVDRAELACGCTIELRQIEAAENDWERKARNRTDDNLRSIFG